MTIARAHNRDTVPLRRYVSQNTVAITVTLRLNRFTLLYVFN